MSTPTFSICHATARVPDGWRASHKEWMANADEPDKLEYVLSVHVDDCPKDWWPKKVVKPVAYIGLHNSVHGWNVAAQAAEGQILILNADDFFPPPHWDTQLLRYTYRGVNTPNMGAFVIHVSTGSPRDSNLISLGILSRPLYNRWGYALYPAYESMYSDDDMTEHAYQDGLVIDARDLVFEHRHHSLGKSVEDDVYRKQSRPEAYAIGKEILKLRRLDNFAK